MTLPNRPHDNTVDSTPAAPAPPVAAGESTDNVRGDDAHVDYDRQPLSVRRLDHYIEGELGDGRFHISG